ARGEQILLTSRLVALADVVEVFHRAGGTDAAVAVARQRRGTQFDPQVVDVFTGHAEPVLAPLAAVAVQHHERLDGSGYRAGCPPARWAWRAGCWPPPTSTGHGPSRGRTGPPAPPPRPPPSCAPRPARAGWIPGPPKRCCPRPATRPPAGPPAQPT